MLSDPITFAVRVTLRDQLALMEALLDGKGARRRRAIHGLIVAFVTPVLGLLFGVFLGWITDHDQSFPAAMASMVRVIGTRQLTTIYGVGFVAMLAVQVARWRLRRPRLRRLIRKTLKSRPGVDPADPNLTEDASCTLGAAGFTADGIASHIRLEWPALQALHETPELLIVLTGLQTGFVVPKRDLDATAIDGIRTMFKRHGLKPSP